MNSLHIDTLGYALAKQIPDMERGFTIAASYGDIEVDAEDAAQVAKVVRDILASKLAALQRGHQ